MQLDLLDSPCLMVDCGEYDWHPIQDAMFTCDEVEQKLDGLPDKQAFGHCLVGTDSGAVHLQDQT